MYFSEISSRAYWFFFGAGNGLALLAIVGACSTSSTSEIGSYDVAVQSQTAEGALAFINANRGSHLVGDLIESLPPNVAVQVCSEMPSNVSGRTARSCKHMREVMATTPTATAPILAAAAPASSAGASADSLGCGGVVAPAAGNAVAAIEPSANVEPIKSKATTAKVVRPVQVAEAYTRETAITSGIEPVTNGRGGKGGDGGGAAHR
jgi:hypothetical protein